MRGQAWPVIYVHRNVEIECAKLRAQGYTNDQIELKDINGFIRAVPLGAPKLQAGRPL